MIPSEDAPDHLSKQTTIPPPRPEAMNISLLKQVGGELSFPGLQPTQQGSAFGDYQLLEELGRGGMGVVYRASEPGLNRQVAIKMLLPSAVAEPGDRARFIAEARAAGRLHHPNIVQVFRAGCVGDHPFYSMALIEGISLAQRLKDGPLPSRSAATYLVAIAEAIQHAHDQGILHRDLKPSNILLDTCDQPHVTDFGLAKQLGNPSTQTRTGALLGTPSYMAPEQANGSKQLTVATDIYGLGAVLYELLTARPPFRGETIVDTILQVIEQEPVPPRLLNPRVDRDLETICLKCLAKRSSDRYPSATALAADLRKYLRGDAISASGLNLLNYLGRALDRSQFDIEFQQYSSVLLWFAAIVGGMHCLKWLAILYDFSNAALVGTTVIQFSLMLLVLWYYRSAGLRPTSTAERQLWSVVIGYVLCSAILSALLQHQFGPEVGHRGINFAFSCVVAGMAFFVLGSSYWGMCYALALLFWLAAPVMLNYPKHASLAFGLLWAGILVTISLRLRRLGGTREHSRPKNVST